MARIRWSKGRKLGKSSKGSFKYGKRFTVPARWAHHKGGYSRLHVKYGGKWVTTDLRRQKV